MPKPESRTVLVADDDPQFLGVMDHHLRGWSYRVRTVADKGSLLEQLAENPPTVVLLDVRFGDHDGIEVLRQIQADYPSVRVVMLTAFGSIETGVSAMKLGAIDYLTKPVNLDRLRSVVADALDTVRSTAPATVHAPVPRPSAAAVPQPIIGESEPVGRLRNLIARAAATDSTVLILGESGTGKELVARALHDQSHRRDKPFIAINVAALPEELVESTLFGHAKGAFTGAEEMRHGCCEAAHGGTLFLDEIGEMDFGLQAKLLRFLQERTFQRVGETNPISVDVRVVAATNRNLLEEVQQGRFRGDLYYRLNVLLIVVTPLRDRQDDIPLLAKHFLARFADRCGRPTLELGPDACDALMRYDWPGNVRELENVVERIAILSPGPIVCASEIRFDADMAFAGPAGLAEVSAADLELTEMERIEKAAISRALAEAGGVVREAASALGLAQSTVYRKVKRYGLTIR